GLGLEVRPAVIHAVASSPPVRSRTTLGHGVDRVLGYAAPEQIGRLKGTWVGPHSDVYALGRTLWYALTGRPEPTASERAAVPEPWREFLDACCAWTLAARPAHLGAVLELLARLPGGAEALAEANGALWGWGVADTTAALALDPADAQAYLDRAAARAAQGELKEAVADYTEALKLRPQDAAILQQRGQTFARMGEAH